MHLELTRAVEHEVEEAEAKARRNGHPSSAPVFQSIADALGQKTRLGQLCQQEPCMSEKQMSRCHSNANLDSIYKQLSGIATPQTAKLFKLVGNVGSGAFSASREQPLCGSPSFHEHAPCHSHDVDLVEHHIPTLTPRSQSSDTDPTKHDIPTRTPPRPDLTPRSEGGFARGVHPDCCNGKDLDLLSETETKTESKIDWHYSASSSGGWEQLPQTPQATPQLANRIEMSAAPGGPHWTTGGAYHDSPRSRDSGSDSVFPQGGRTVMPMDRGIPLHQQSSQPGQGPMVKPMNGAFQRHAQIREADVQQLPKGPNFFYA